MLPARLTRLVHLLSRLPGVGEKTAQRFALVMVADRELCGDLSQSLHELGELTAADLLHRPLGIEDDKPRAAPLAFHYGPPVDSAGGLPDGRTFRDIKEFKRLILSDEVSIARNLAKLSPLPLVFWDERLSTSAVERMLIESNRSRARRAEIVDKLAAAYILQSALDRLAHLP